jgi:hypothetical protein
LNITDYQNCPSNTYFMRQQTNALLAERIDLGTTYVRCDKMDSYCSFKLENLTSSKCAAECINLGNQYAGTMDE